MKSGLAVVLVAVLCLSVLSGFLRQATAQQSTGDWPMFLADPSHSSVGAGTPVLASTLVWKSNVTFTAPASAVENGVSGIDTSWSSPAIVDDVAYACAGTTVRTDSGYGESSWGDVFALNASSGTVIWDYRDYSSAGLVGPSPAVADGEVFFGFDLGYIGALNASDGASLWNYTAAEAVLSSPTVVGGVVYIGLGMPSASVVLDGTGILPYNVFAFNATNGDKIWNYNFTQYSYCYSSPAVVNGVVYVGSGGAGSDAGGNVYALNATDGTQLWSYTMNWTPKYSDSWVDSSPAVANGVVYVGCEDGNVYALNAMDGKKLWSFTTNGEVDSSPAVAGGIVYIGSADGNLYALNAQNGEKQWNFTSGGPIYSSPVIVGGVVYLWQDYTGVFYSLNRYTGAVLSNYTIGASYSGNMVSAAFVNGVVYIGSQTDQVYALSGPSVTINAPKTLAIGVASAVVVAAAAVAAVVLVRKGLKKSASQ